MAYRHGWIWVQVILVKNISHFSGPFLRGSKKPCHIHALNYYINHIMQTSCLFAFCCILYCQNMSVRSSLCVCACVCVCVCVCVFLCLCVVVAAAVVAAAVEGGRG